MLKSAPRRSLPVAVPLVYGTPCSLRFAIRDLRSAGFDLGAPDIMQRSDVGMIQAGDDAGFTFKTLTQVRPIGKPLRQHFDSDDAVQSCVAGLVDFPFPLRQSGRGFRRDLISCQVSGPSATFIQLQPVFLLLVTCHLNALSA